MHVWASINSMHTERIADSACSVCAEFIWELISTHYTYIIIHVYLKNTKQHAIIPPVIRNVSSLFDLDPISLVRVFYWKRDICVSFPLARQDSMARHRADKTFQIKSLMGFESGVRDKKKKNNRIKKKNQQSTVSTSERSWRRFYRAFDITLRIRHGFL